ncbi:MAG TPA: hypothetical protein VMK84_16555 [Streptosporangiaceae bacterium]|nr:hypothetical protein [Streptosporangiaceae bacterium]
MLVFEWTKLRSVRSNHWTLLIAAVVTLGLSMLVLISWPAAALLAAALVIAGRDA